MRCTFLVGTILSIAACGQPPGEELPQEPVPVHTDGPPYPAPEPAAITRFRTWQDRLAQPAVYLDPAGPAPATPGGSRIGGPVWLAASETWPHDSKGGAMTFLGQVDFAALPPLPDYPRAGVLQFFIGRDMNYGADFQRPDRGDFRVIYRPDFNAAGSLRTSPISVSGADHLAPIDGATVTRGVALRGATGTSRPTINHWQLARDLPDVVEGRGRGRVIALLDERFVERAERHHVGGHPEFVQDDWRRRPAERRANRVLLNLWSRDGVMWGDAGQGQFLIARDDLLKRDFNKVFYAWDSS
jgi:uncharacterized protein YwqG